MKRLVRDFLITLSYYSGVARVYRWRMRKRGPLVRILCFHDVPDQDWFAGIVEMLTAKYHVLTPQDFYEHRFDPDKINVLLTFDDGYQSWVDVVLPVLEQHNAKGLFFITSGLLDAAEEGEEAVAHFVRNRLLLNRTYHTLTWEGAEQLVAAGHTIGGHTATHPSLGELEDSELIRREVAADKKRIESKFSIHLTDFAYPFGRSHNMSQLADDGIAQAGYQHRYSAETGFTSTKQPYSRTMVEEFQSTNSLCRWVEGAYDIVKSLF